MKTFSIIYLLSSIFPCFLHNTHAFDTITASQPMKDGETIVSSGGSFEMGFFSPGNSSNRYVGIWYKTIPVFTVVWVANRQVPITNKSAILKVNVRPPGGFLILVDGANENNTIWSWPPTNTSRLARNPILQLLDTGNLVVREEGDPNPDNFYWQSFDYPTDTLLSGMKLGKDFETGLERYLSSWKSKGDPAPGDYTYHCDPTGYPQLVLRRKSVEYFRLGSWNGLGFSGLLTTREPDSSNTLRYGLVMNERETYYSFDLVSKSSLSRLQLSPDGISERWWWVSGTKSWTLYLAAPTDPCDTYSRCGAYSTCNVICECLDGFIPKNQSEWDMNDWSKGCTRKQGLDCIKGDGFRKYSGLKLPDTKSSWSNKSMTLDECEAVCLNNCSCMAYATLDVKAGTGCLIWLGDLIDMKELNGNYQDLYVRMASTDSDLVVPKHGSKEKKGLVIKVALPLAATMILLTVSLIVFVRRKKTIGKHKREERLGNLIKKDGIHDKQKEIPEIPFFDISTIAQATKMFSFSNKLGEGGFGPVYKGVLEDGQEIAVKRLSKTSTQGPEEFKNEVICIAKLQHRNLVKLLGYCIQEDEMMLVYEYLPNKSLDAFLFDESPSTLLDWPKRFHIINGIARGLLYLHQDSRLRIIHRDLKASNILLDYDMNPKISDFGLAKRFGGNEIGDNTKTVVGTYGYMSPEYAVHGLFSVKSDVFSFGVMVLEIVSGKRNRGFIHPEHCQSLLGHAWKLYKEGKSMDLVDSRLQGSLYVPEILRSINVGLLCVQQSPEDRPNMSSVVLMLSGEGSLPQPKQPGFFNQCNIHETAGSSSGFAQNSVNGVSITLVQGR